MLFYNLESSDLPSPLGAKAHYSQGMAASKAFLVLQRCRVVYAPHIHQVLNKDLRATPGSSVLLLLLCSSTLGRDLQVRWHGYLVPLAFLMQLEFPEGKVPGYVCNHGSLSVGHYELCRDDIGDLPGSPEHL